MARRNTKWRKRVFRQLVVRDGGACRQCGEPDRTIWRNGGVYSSSVDIPGSTRHTRVFPCSNLNVEHVVALSDGGSNALNNLQLLCVDCHKKKTAGERRVKGGPE